MSEAALKQAWSLQQAGQHGEAARLYADVLRTNPRNFDALFQLGNIYLVTGHPADSERLYARAAQINSQSPELFYNRGCAAMSLSRHEDALAAFAHALALRPDFTEARNNRGVTLLSLKRHKEALACFDRVLADRPGLATVQNNRATALLGLLRQEEALAAAELALCENPQDAHALYNRGAALMMIGRLPESLSQFDKALSVNRDYADALIYRGIVLAVLNRHEEALASYNMALVIRPGDIEILYNRATSLWALKRFEEAIPDCEEVLKRNPHFKYARGNLVQSRLQCCDWQNLTEDKVKIVTDLHNGVLTLNPLQSIVLFDSPDMLLQAARLWIANECAPAMTPLWQGEIHKHDRIRIAYMSADFRMHAVALLVAGVFEHHDRTRFETTAISIGPNDSSPMRARLETAFDRFIDVQDRTDAEVAELIREMEIDILIDLTGFTQHGRTGILARRPAGIQVNFLGFPGTMGAPYIDYILVDETVIVEADQRYFEEKVAYLPETYLPNDFTRAIAEHSPSRAESGLPENGFVFCTFNNLSKITPETFDVWMRLLENVPDSVLWLSQANPSAIRNLRREAQARGIAGNRILFAPFVQAPEEHLARLRLADLFLDTRPYNAHATACDALWAGVPMVTQIGSSFAGRVGASLLTAIGLPELIAHSEEEYEALALRLARDPTALALLKEKLANNRMTHPLFDTARFTRDLESAYLAMWERHRRGESPRGFRSSETIAQ
ncbi:MAG TPA: tetratricopeptide repeat protein [Micropepsaceae bacterium]